METTFALRFSTPEVALEFKAEFIKGQAEMTKLLSGADAVEGSKEAAELSEAIESLTVDKDKTSAEGSEETSTTEKTSETSAAVPVKEESTE